MADILEREGDDVLKTPEAAALLGFNIDTLVKAANEGRIPCWKTPGGHRRFSRSALIAWKETQTEPDRAAS